MVKNITYILAILLFISNYHICNYFYYNDVVVNIDKWWGLKSNIYVAIIMLVLLGSTINSKGWLRFIINIGIGFCLSSLIDKVFFNVFEFRENDIIMIILTFCFAIIEFLNNKKNEHT